MYLTNLPTELSSNASVAFRLRDFGLGHFGCAFCGGLGHRVATCPKLEAHRMKQIMGGGRDDLAGTAGRGFGGAGTDW